MIYRDIVLIRSGGDISSGIIERLYKCGFKVVVLETGNPSSIRREVSFGEAVYRKVLNSFIKGAILMASGRVPKTISIFFIVSKE